MNEKLEAFKKEIQNKKVAVVGIGVSHTPLIEYLLDLGVDVTAFDKAERPALEPVLERFQGKDIQYSLGEDYLKNLTGFDLIFKTPGMRYDLPELVKAVEEGAKMTSEMEVFFKLCPAQIFGITGSDGKTTTTTLIYNLLKEQGYRCWLGGNIGMPLLSKIDDIRKEDKVVLELSSFQLHTMNQSPSVAVVTNVSPNHLDVHKSMEEYVDAKRNIFKYQDPSQKVILNFDNKITREFESEAKGQVAFFSRCSVLEEGAFLQGDQLVYKKGDQIFQIVKAEEIKIPGVHNIENYLAAICATSEYVEPQTIYKVATAFSGVEHRIELVREKDGIKFYNDSIASSPTRTMAGLNAFKQKVILISGGYDKKIPYDSMGTVLMDKVKCLITLGQTAPKIEKALADAAAREGQGSKIPVTRCGSLEDAVKSAYAKAGPGDIVILSPASASFDMFKNFEERGNCFKEIVNGI